MNAKDHAFPLSIDSHGAQIREFGLTQRDYVAIAAMQALIIADKATVDLPKVAEKAYAMADTMLSMSSKK
jgi:hypothetical protein